MNVDVPNWASGGPGLSCSIAYKVADVLLQSLINHCKYFSDDTPGSAKTLILSGKLPSEVPTWA